jgi:hypothetical protein
MTEVEADLDLEVSERHLMDIVVNLEKMDVMHAEWDVKGPMEVDLV